MEPRKTPDSNLENKKFAWTAIGFVAVLALLLSSFNWTSFEVSERNNLVFDVDLLEDEIIPANIVQPPPPPPPPQPTTIIEIVEDEEDIEEDLDVEDLDLDEDTEIEEIEEVVEEEEDDTPFMIVENMPALGPCKSLRGDERHNCTQTEIIKYISANTKYPPIARDAMIQGTVYVYFEVNRKGKVDKARVMRPVDSRLDKEALRVVNSMGPFEPGKQRGKPVNVQYTIPVKFIIK